MKRFITSLICLPLLFACTDRISGDSIISEQIYEISSDIESISIKSAMTLNLVNSLEVGEMTIEANSNIHQYINVIRRDNTISIELDENNYNNLSVNIYASAAQYQNVAASGASVVRKESAMGDFKYYSIELSGASSFSGDVNISRDITCSLSGASTLTLDGWADNCDITSSGASYLYGGDFACTDLKVSLSGASYMEMEVNGDISGELSGASVLKYSGSPNSLDIDIKGDSSISKK